MIVKSYLRRISFIPGKWQNKVAAERFKTRTGNLQKPGSGIARSVDAIKHPPDTSGRDLETILADMEKEIISCTQEVQAITRQARQAGQKNARILTAINQEICSPMNAIIALAQRILESDNDTRQNVIAKTIAQSGQSALTTISNALELSGTETAIVDIPGQPGTDHRDSAQLIDVEYVNELKRNFETVLFRSLVQQYCRDAEQALHDLEQAVENRDFPAAQNLLHLLKGCSANFGALAFVELCTGYTIKLKSGQGMTETDISQLKQIYDITKDRLLQIEG